jgi:hypothetical protein
MTPASLDARAPGIANIVIERDRLEQERANEVADHVARLSRIDAQLAEHKRLVEAHAAGTDTDRVVVARSIITIHARTPGLGGDRRAVLADAIRSIARNGSAPQGVYRGLRDAYYGTKNYDRWTDQRSDHAYGFGPSHGSTVFSVGLTRAYRRQPLTDEQVDACIYYLEAFRDGRVAALDSLLAETQPEVTK